MSGYLIEDRTTILISIDEGQAVELTRRAESMHLSVSMYCRLILEREMDAE